MLQCLSPEENQQLREFLRDSGYNLQTLVECFGNNEVAQIQMMKIALVAPTLPHNRQNTILRWFWSDTPVEEAAVREFIPGHILDLFLKSGMVEEKDGSFVSAVRISPFSGNLVLSDPGAVMSGSVRQDTVLWPNPTTMTCFHLAMQTPVETTLDLGTGTGVLALTAAPHSGRVVATDLNPRAGEFCRFNAALNGYSNIEFREGSAYEPVRGERFDLILANPPFFVTPSVRRVFSDNSMELDGFCRTLVRKAHEHLVEGGYCQMLAEWVQIEGQPWRDRLSEWFNGIGCDAWVLSSYMRSSLDYTLIRQQEDREALHDSEAQAALTKTWRTYFESRRVEAIFGGMIVLRRRSDGPNWVRMEELQAPVSRPVGNFMRRVFEVRDYLATHSDEQLMAARPSLPPASRLSKDYAPTPDGLKLASIDLRLGDGLPYSLPLQPQVADFLALCTGKRTLGEIADNVAAGLSVDPAMVRKESAGMIRRLADKGLVVL
jgi:methylase of polypeptide subunit release factors